MSVSPVSAADVPPPNPPLRLSRAESRAADRLAVEGLGIPSPVLMENAGRGAAEVLAALGIPGPVAVCCGKGNNGGDGLVLARHLHRLGIPVWVHLFADRADLGVETALHLQVAVRLGLPCKVHPPQGIDPSDLAGDLARCSWIVDALFGTGLAGPLRAPFDALVPSLNAAAAGRFALDIPSGLDADTGEPLGPTVRADHTATFGYAKKGFGNAAARAWLGKVHVVDIGVGPSSLLHPTLPEQP